MDNLALRYQFAIQQPTTSASHRPEKFQPSSCPALSQSTAHPRLGHHFDLTGRRGHWRNGSHRRSLRIWWVRAAR